MNGYERITRTFAGLPTDRTPAMIHSFMAAAEESGISMKQYRENPALMADCLISFAEKYELDGVLTDVDTALEAHAMGAVVDFPEHEPARVTDPAPGDLAEMTARISVERLFNDERIRIYLDAIKIIKSKIGGRLLLRGNADQGPFSLAMLVYGMENFFMDLMDPEKEAPILALMAKCYDVHLAFHRAIMEAGADMTSFGDSSCGPDLMSRELYLKFANPWHRRLCADLNQSAIKTSCHICGKLDLILDDVANVGFTALDVDYKTSITKAHDALSGRATMFGPIDPSGVFFFGSPELVYEKTRAVLDVFRGKGLVIGAGCALPRGVPEANIRSFVRALQA